MKVDPTPMDLEDLKDQLWRSRFQNKALLADWLSSWTADLDRMIAYGFDAFHGRTDLRHRYEIYVATKLEDEEWIHELYDSQS